MPRGEEKGGQVRRVVRVEMGDEDLVHRTVVDAGAGELPEGARARVDEGDFPPAS
jgi:hypothetical protein